MDFDKDLNISYVDDALPAPDNKLIFKHYLCSCILYASIYGILFCNPFFNKLFLDTIRMSYIIVFCLYVILAPIIFFVFKPKSIYVSHAIEIFNYIKRQINNIFCKNSILKEDYKTIFEKLTPTYREKQSIMLIFIKVFFGALMVRFLFDDCIEIKRNLIICREIFNFEYINHGFNSILRIIENNNDFFCKFTITILFTIDVFFFALGYITEAAFLKNKIRTVETSAAGIFFCLLCYPPFNYITTRFLGWNQNDGYLLHSEEIYIPIWIIRVFALFFLAIYAISSVALGTKASNLTNRGIVSRFPYNIVRHPAYISKVLFWTFTTIPVFIINFNADDFDLSLYVLKSVLIILSCVFWILIYYFRAITEERHLMQDPQYQEYSKKVKYRFIPFVI